MGLLRILLIILLVYYGIKVLFRIAGPLLFKYASKKAQQQFNQHRNPHTPHRYKKTDNEGEITIDKRGVKPPNTGKKVGEYIDFEEID